jgi:hypothetical protein
LTDREFSSSRVVIVTCGVNTHRLSHLQLIQISSRGLSQFFELSLNLESLKLFLGGLHTLMEWCLLLLLVLLLTLRAIAVLLLHRSLAKLLAGALLLHLVNLLVLLSVSALSLDESALVGVSSLSQLSDTS